MFQGGTMAKKKPMIPASDQLRAQLREAILYRIEALGLSSTEAASIIGMSIAQVSRLRHDHGLLSTDRLADAAQSLGLIVQLRVIRPYRKR